MQTLDHSSVRKLRFPSKSKKTNLLDILPSNFVPYVELTRLHYFLGPNLLFWPCAWGVMLAAIDKQVPIISVLKATLAYYVFGGYVLHSAGSIWNDIIDKDLDALVERTKNRPLPSGRISVSATLLFLFPQVVLMTAVMYFYTNTVAFTLGMIGLFFWVPLYPFMKRITYWPQAWLGIAGNWGLLVAYASLAGDINFNTAGVLFFGTWCWCIHYDTIYGMMDKKDDARVGIKSTALLFGSSARPILAGFALGFLAALYLCGLNLDASNIYHSLAVGGSALHLVWQLATVDFDSNPSCFKMFTSNAKQLAYFVYIGLISVYLSRS